MQVIQKITPCLWFDDQAEEAVEFYCSPAGGAVAVRHSRPLISGAGTSKTVSEDFYCDEALSGRTPVEVVVETDEVLAFRHTRPFWPVHIVVIPKRHVPSLIDLGDTDEILLHKVLAVVRRVADQVMRDHGACRVLTNLGSYQDSKHLHFHVNFGEPVR